MRLLVVAALSLSSVGISSLAAAQAGDQDRARLHFQAGASYYEAGDYEDALREFQRSYELSGKPELFYNLSLCYQQIGNLEEAANYLERYLAEVVDIPNRPNLERRLENFRERIAAQAQASGQGQDGGSESATGSDAGSESATGSDAGSDATEGVDATAGDATEDVTSGDPTTAPTGGEPTTSGGGANVPAIVGFSIAGAGAVMLGVSGALALVKRADLDDEGCEPNCPSSDVRSLKVRAAFADVGLGLAVVGAALDVVYLVIGGGHEDDASARAVRFEPFAGPRGGGAALRGRF